MRTITLEEHFATPGFLDGPGRELRDQARQVGGRAEQLMRDLCDLDAGRIAQMDAAGIDMQVISLTAPGVEQLEPVDAVALARDTNDVLAEAIARHPTRLSGFAALAIAQPDLAAKELDRRVGGQRFAGAVINGHQRGRYLDDKFFWPVLEAAEALSAPIYLHPTRPPRAVIEASFGGFSPLVTEMLAGPGFGWHIETAVHVLRMVLGGVFDRFPKLQIVIGHMGEGLPFFMQRVDVMPVELTKLRRPVSAYLRDNLHYTFAGFNFPATFLDLLLEIGVGRIMFSADYPYASMVKARGFLDQIPVTAADRALIAHGNAEKLFRL
ncbi:MULTISPECIES: amidohydrolase family protein [unclassified Bradyrhizobium]|jgi:predicted TIM-barrel fold metal-dependent hydrolase|uniref:amidohydrolase family protein n=1 Tax=unclassified Bradyrhizobium TaxID=2631580 RepID=UPI0003F5AC1F|nr:MULTISPECIES: amidohydrolase family protein [unclassified Bradyrhizobium]MBK5653435.1 amidohydrolase [Rhizobium sp.]OCX27286.1 amidohydrolase [Bradyrhizobium sp. UASWS1016]